MRMRLDPAGAAQRSTAVGGGRRRARIGALAGAVAASVLIAACGGSSKSPTSSSEANAAGVAHKLNIARVQAAIQLRILEQRHLHSKVECPKEVEQRQGNTFTCVATGTAKGKSGHLEAYRTPFTVEQLNSRGYVYFHS